MKEGYRKLLVLTIVLLSAFLVVTGIRKISNTPGLLDFIKNSVSTDEEGGQAILAKDPPIAVDEIPMLQKLNAEYTKLTEAVMPSVVSLNTVGVEGKRVIDRFGRPVVQRSETTSQGSGVIVSYEGHVITNYHVIANKQKIQVITEGNHAYWAEIVGMDPMLDIAVLKINGKGKFKPLKFGDSDEVREGNIVLAFGNPFQIGKSVTNGVISARERSLSDQQGELLQSSAAVNPGYSGGPLVNTKGEIIGINSQIYTTDQKNPGFQGISFSIPSNIVKDTFEAIRERGRPVRGFLGVSMENLTPNKKLELSYGMSHGALIDRVGPDTPAEKAGLQHNDIVLEYNNKQVRDPSHLIGMVQRTKVGEKVPMTIWRDQRKVQITAEIKEYDSILASLSKDQEKIKDPMTILNAVGIDVYHLSQEERRKGYTGVKVQSIIAKSQAEGLLEKGDIITHMDNRPISQPDLFYRYLLNYAIKRPITLTVIKMNDNNVRKVTIQPLNQR
ncbi:hypothetical protein Rhal01_02628 [Rubritalea halochordaticola]|uniref:PDZ domain-containing protein n=1 Tax=Rubritalea halochordaticola TaxID=714537 RepID=A0ABP9V4E2_9BACT